MKILNKVDFLQREDIIEVENEHSYEISRTFRERKIQDGKMEHYISYYKYHNNTNPTVETPFEDNGIMRVAKAINEINHNDDVRVLRFK